MQLSECYAQLVIDSPHPDGNDAVETVIFLNAGDVMTQTGDGLTLLVLRKRLDAPSHILERGREDGACGFGLACITNQRKATRVYEINWSVQNQWTFAVTEASEHREEEERVHAERWGVQVSRATVRTRRYLFIGVLPVELLQKKKSFPICARQSMFAHAPALAGIERQWKFTG